MSQVRERWSERHAAALLLAAAGGLAIRLYFLPTNGYVGDITQFVFWANHIAVDGLPSAYDQNITFGPVITYVWWLLGVLDPAIRFAENSLGEGVRVAMKLPATIADFGIAATVVYALRARPIYAVGGAILILYNPAIFLVSSWWGQYDSIYALAALVAAVFAISGWNGLAAAALAIALMTKPQTLPLLLPFAAWVLARDGPLGLVRAAAIGLGVSGLLWLPFITADGPHRYLDTIEFSQRGPNAILSLRAWNVWWIIQGLWTGQSPTDQVRILGPFTARTVGLAITGVLSLGVAALVWRDPRPKTLILGLAAVTLVSFSFLTLMHERYAYAAVVFLALLLPDKRLRWLGLAYAVIFAVNLVAAASNTPYLPPKLLPIGGTAGVLGSLATVAIALTTLVALWWRSRDPSEGALTEASGPRRRRDTSGGSAAATSGA